MIKNLQNETYVRENLGDSTKNAYYFVCGGCNVILRNPRKYLSNGRFEYAETNNIPTYSVRFETEKMASKFIETSIADFTQNVDVKQYGTIVFIKPTNTNYQLWIELDSEDLAKKMVKVFRHQYVSNVQLQQPVQLVK